MKMRPSVSGIGMGGGRGLPPIQQVKDKSNDNSSRWEEGPKDPPLRNNKKGKSQRVT